MSAERRVVDAIAQRADELVELACELIRLDTTTRGAADDPPRDEARLQERVAALLASRGAEVELWEPRAGELDRWRGQVPEGLGFEGRPQLLARFPGRAGGPSLLFNGHIDAVSAEPVARWSSPPLRPAVRDGMLFGRGACDMKGGVAAMLLAAVALVDEGVALAGDLLVNTVTDEEWNGAGALASVARGVAADAGIVPEATGFRALVACRGVVAPTITVRGRAGHAELPQPDWREGGAVNAIDKAMVVLDAIGGLRRRWREASPPHRHLHPGDLVPTMIAGGDWWVTYPSSCELTLDVTYLPAQGGREGDGHAVEREIEEWVCERTRADPWLAANPPRFVWGTSLTPAEIPDEHPIVGCVRAGGESVGRPGGIGGLQSWHDAATFSRFGTPTISYGPAGIASDGESLAHAIDEHVPVADLVACAQALAVAAIRWQEDGRRAPQRAVVPQSDVKETP